jgi:hypothetical protein
MREAVQYLSWLFWFPLVFLVIAALLRGAYRRYPLVLAYTVASFLTAVIEMAARLGYASGATLRHTFAQYYWVDDGLRQALLFTVVISLLYQATRQTRARAAIRASLIGAAVLVACVSFLIHYDSQAVTGKWMTLWTRDLDFVSAILDLALWAILLNSRKHDMELLMLSGALGIRFTGEAIGHALRNQFPAILLAADTTVVLANLACFYIWWQVFRTSPVRKVYPVGTHHL